MKNVTFSNDLLFFLLVMLLLSISIAGNSLVVIAVMKKRSLRSTTNFLLVNLALADIVTTTFLPLMLVERYVALEKGVLADFLCKFFVSFHVPLTASTVSILTLVVLSVERYHAVVKPMKTGIRLRKDTVKYAIIAVWTCAIVLTLPLYIFGHYELSTSYCFYTIDENINRVLIVVLAVVVVFFPFFVIGFCYFEIVHELYFKNKVVPQNVAAAEDVRNKRKLVKLSLSVTTAFLLCFFPLAVTISLTALDPKRFPHKYYQGASVVLYFAEVVLNPFLYPFQSTNFRQAFKEIIMCRHARG